MNSQVIKGVNANASGFTLIELMISLVLGLLVSAAVLQVYLINTRTITVQQSASEVQDSTIFALQAIENNIRSANLGNPISNINDSSSHGGIVLSAANVENIADIKEAYMTVSAGQTGVGSAANGWTGISNTQAAGTDAQSDQLTIQYKNITSSSLYDCEGAEIAQGSSDWVIERYFLRTGSTAGSVVKDLVLACDAGRISAANVVSDFGDKGEVVAPGVDQFKVLLGTITNVAELSYLPASTYMELTEKPPITTVKLGVVISSSTPLITDIDKTEFSILGETHTLKTDNDRTKRYRRSYESTILLRSARVMSVTGIQSNVQS